MGLGKQRRSKSILKNRQVNFGDVAHGGRRTVRKNIKSFKHSQTRRDRLEGKRISKLEQ